ncbi:MAG: methionyl-tRNA formyltransferase [Bacteroidales bacterium]|jgi:methionyl-tRNA formyltransferase|nr:methionyl-tRNA formyltransferase [Bacteroidales bacterium]MDD4086148.1 methionyl-tRNA formyltransferase [Bacteroidales bacterium]MDY0086322.1 methionyl-tRNA formyltransferase [Bacteroidales bacterium]
MNAKLTKPSIVFFGTPEFAAAQLQAILEAEIPVKAVVTAPDKPAGRGKKMQQSAVKALAIKKGLNLLQPPNLKHPDFINTLRAMNADIFVVVAFRMLPAEVWKMPRLGTFNLHASLLPQYRGAAPINRAIMNGENESGITTFLLDEKIDEGSILMQKRMSIAADETAGNLHDRMMEAGKQLVVDTLYGLANNDLSPQPQTRNQKLFMAPKLFKEDCRINWKNDLTTVYNQIRGLSPYPGAFTTLINKVSGQELVLKIFQSEIDMERNMGELYTLLTDQKSFIKIIHPDGALALKEIQTPGKRSMSVQDFLNGFDLKGSWKVDV